MKNYWIRIEELRHELTDATDMPIIIDSFQML